MTVGNQHHINVEFIENLPIETVVAEINKIKNPHVVIWCIGCNGLRKAGADFYKHNLLTPVLHQNPESTFWLMDLTAWNAFKKTRSSIAKSNRCCDMIERFSGNQLKCIRSSQIFQKMQEISDQDLIDYFRKAFRRDFICEGSNHYPNKGIFVKEIFSNHCPIMIDWYEYDANKCYSIFQYLEGCLIVDEIFKQSIVYDQRCDFQIIFALPNNESKYYKDEQCSFQNDIEFIINKHSELFNLEKINLEIKFLTFKYSSQLEHRPYNAIGKVIKPKNLSYDDIVGRLLNEESKIQWA